MNRFSTYKLALLWLIYFATHTVAAAQGLTAVKDVIRTGPLQTVTRNIILNDKIPDDIYSWQFVASTLPATNQGTLVQKGDNIVFKPAANYHGTLHVQYKLTGIGTESIGEIEIIVHEYNNPVNIIDPDIKCFEIMPENVPFGIRPKYKTEPNGHYNWIDGYTSPLVGDLTGDGKPEIVIAGNNDSSRPGNAFPVQYINIYNGQTGKLMHQYDIRTKTNNGLDWKYFTIGDHYHRPPSIFALADLDDDDLGEIVICNVETGHVAALKPVVSNYQITNLEVMWRGTDNTGAEMSYKAPLASQSRNVYGYPNPYIADIDADGTPEVTVYNKIFDGVSGRLVMSWQDEAVSAKPSDITGTETGLRTDRFYSDPVSQDRAASIRGSAMAGMRRGNGVDTDEYIPVPAIVDIDGDGKLEIITGNRIHKFDIRNKTDHTKNTYTTIEGPQSVTVLEGSNNTSVPEESNNTPVTYYLNDGFTRVADINGDGKQDIIVTCNGNHGYWDTKIIVYVWEWDSASAVKACISFRGDVYFGNFSIPFVGDINGKQDGWDGSGYTKKLPEICILTGLVYIDRKSDNEGRTGIKFHPLSDEDLRRGANNAASSSDASPGWNNNNTSSNSRRFNRTTLFDGVYGGHIIGLTWDDRATEIEEKLKVSWAMEHLDQSNDTGITLFDFDNNNTADLCYRDEKTLRVISPGKSGRDYIEYDETKNSPNSSIMFNTTVNNGTAYEYPTIADVNMDGSADIVVTNTGVADNQHSGGWIEVYEYDGAKWAPCPPVWNQGMYDPTMVREDLKINARPVSMLKPYSKNGKTVYPYNGSWMQAPVVRDENDFKPVVRYPDAIITNMKVKVNSPSSTTVTLDIFNAGSATIAASAPINFYDGKTLGENNTLPASSFITMQQVGVDIFPSEQVSRTYHIPNGGFNDHLIWACIMADNNLKLVPGYNDCELANNALSAADCPYFKYTTIATPDAVLCGATDDVLLTAAPDATPKVTPSYQWYRNGEPVPGANAPTYRATHTGVYKCYVVEGICRDFSSPKTVTREEPVAVDDHVSVSSGVQTKLNVLLNDNKSEYCNPLPEIVTGKGPWNGTAYVDTEGKMVYISTAAYTGYDSVYYRIDNSEAKVRIQVTNLPDNVIRAHCSAVPPSPYPLLSIRETNLNLNTEVHNFGPLTVGDIDDDNTVEIIGFMKNNAVIQNDYESEGLVIFHFDRDKQTVELEKKVLFNGHTSAGAMAIARYQNKGYIVVAGTDHYLYAYNAKTGLREWKSDYTYHSSSNNYGSIVSIADFDGNGVPEVYTGNTIFSLDGGKRICDGGSSGNRGQLYMSSGSMSFAADIIGSDNGKLELCAGNTVYDVNIATKTMTAVRTLPPSSLPAGAHRDGATVVADIDNDGQLDIIVVSKNPNGTPDRTVVYVWTPGSQTGGNLTGYFEVPENTDYYGIPATGNIDDTPEPEIVFSGTSNRVFALKYAGANAQGNRIEKKWDLSLNNTSSRSGISLFDFNFDGKNEIVYRDRTNLYVVDGSGTVMAKSENVLSNTLREFPVVADIDDDGQAEIVTTGHNSTANAQNGYIRVFKSGGAPWTSARKVWNQYACNSVNINENMTVPAAQFHPASVFPGLDGDINSNADNLRPFNGFMQQQTLMDKNGIPVMLTPNVFFTETPTFYHDDSGDSLLIYMQVKNTGEVDLQAPFYISAYKNGTSRISIDSSMLRAGTGKTRHLTVKIRNFSSHLPLNNVTVVVNNRKIESNAFKFDLYECNYDDNDTVFRYSGDLLLAHNDIVSTVAATPITVDILANDTIPNDPGICATPTLTVSAKHGDASVVNGKVQYTAKNGFTGCDTVTYRLECSGKVSTAKVYILVQRPLAQVYAACAGATVKMGFAAITGVQYHWYSAKTGDATVTGGDNANELTVIKGHAADIGTWWVEARAGNIRFPRYRVDLESGDCGVTDPQNCAKNGTVLFKDDATNQQAQFYTHQIDGVCEGFTLYFSAWINNMLTGTGRVNQIFVLEDLDGNVVAKYYTGDIPGGNAGRKQYGFLFTVPDNMSSIILKIVNNGTGVIGSDFALDDVEIRLCTPPVTMNIADTTVCAGTKLDIVGAYVDNCTFGDALSHRLEFRRIDSDTWETLESDTKTVNCASPAEPDRTLTVSYTIPSTNSSHEGYYRMIVSSSAYFGEPNCRAASGEAYVKVTNTDKLPDIRIDVCPAPGGNIRLTKFVDSLAHNTVVWEKRTASAPNILNPNTGEINSAGLLYLSKYRYSMVSKCGKNSAIAYVNPLRNRFTRHVDTIVVCKDEERSRGVLINRILGLEIKGGAWTYPVDPGNTVSSNMKTVPASSSYHGAEVFDAYQAWKDAQNAVYAINYRGDANARKFVFRYTAPAGDSCIGAVSKDIVIVVTEKMF